MSAASENISTCISQFDMTGDGDISNTGKVQDQAVRNSSTKTCSDNVICQWEALQSNNIRYSDFNDKQELPASIINLNINRENVICHTETMSQSSVLNNREKIEENEKANSVQDRSSSSEEYVNRDSRNGCNSAKAETASMVTMDKSDEDIISPTQKSKPLAINKTNNIIDTEESQKCDRDENLNEDSKEMNQESFDISVVDKELKNYFMEEGKDSVNECGNQNSDLPVADLADQEQTNKSSKYKKVQNTTSVGDPAGSSSKQISATGNENETRNSNISESKQVTDLRSDEQKENSEVRNEEDCESENKENNTGDDILNPLSDVLPSNNTTKNYDILVSKQVSDLSRDEQKENAEGSNSNEEYVNGDSRNTSPYKVSNSAKDETAGIVTMDKSDREIISPTQKIEPSVINEANNSSDTEESKKCDSDENLNEDSIEMNQESLERSPEDLGKAVTDKELKNNSMEVDKDSVNECGNQKSDLPVADLAGQEQTNIEKVQNSTSGGDPASESKQVTNLRSDEQKQNSKVCNKKGRESENKGKNTDDDILNSLLGILPSNIGTDVTDSNVSVSKEVTSNIECLKRVRYKNRCDAAALESHKKENTFHCTECPWAFPSRSELEIHENKCHKNRSNVITGSTKKNERLKRASVVYSRTKPFQCPTCKCSFYERSELKAHSKEKRCLKCDICELTFMKRKDLNSHIVSHNAEPKKPVACEICGKTFSQAGNMKIHLRIHTKEKPYGCEQCGKRYAQSGDLKTHIRVHTDEKPYLCEVCGNLFHSLSHLARHSKVHTKEKPYTCKVCEKSFAHTHHLKKHYRIHTQEKPYSCDTCGKAFSRADYLKQHNRVHTKEKPYICQICGKGFSQGGSLKLHQRVHARQGILAL